VLYQTPKKTESREKSPLNDFIKPTIHAHTLIGCDKASVEVHAKNGGGRGC
jgi:hypothetical protein